ncbi:IS3 family transposase [Geobacter sp. SVR]|uniref:IS3 family transposase n=1 Tax=Geobacter sp. SVR TaxID=2495594 RepID=UPI00194E9670|nr:IS3 family transposase [Geobacter sp. SVR]
MTEHRSEFGVKEMCRVLGVTRSWYYAHAAGRVTNRQREDQALLPTIKSAFEESDKTYGAKRITHNLRQLGRRVGKNRIWRLMRENGLKVKTTRKFKVTTNSDHKRPVADNLVKRQFSADAPNRLWTGDITYIETVQGWLYLAVVLDVFSRRIVGWSMNKRMTDDLVIAALTNAIVRRRPSPGFIFHTDRGSQYCSKRFRAVVGKAAGIQSMSGTGCCYDNAITETFFSTLKRELIYHCSFTTRQGYIEGFYNRKRIHSAIGYLTPEQFEQQELKMAA